MQRLSHQRIIQTLVEDYGQTQECLQFATYISAYQYLKLYRLLEKYAPVADTVKVLDWGTGSGHFSYFLAQAGYQASGFGFSSRPLTCQNLAESNYAYHQGSPKDPTTLPFAEAVFDVVVSVGVLEHVRETGGDELSSLKEIYRVLKPGGHFLCFHFPNRYSWIEFLARFTNRFSHPYLFTSTDIRALAEATPFQLLEVDRYALLPRNIWQATVLSHRRWGPIAASTYNWLDWAAGKLLPYICQNYYFVTRKPVEPASPERASLCQTTE
ncbi:MAG: methyltransferase domain-containing protein [Leptolyngbyaceae cyanobacterium]